MTRRDFFNAIANNETLDMDLRNFAAASIEKMDSTNAKRAAKPSKTALENAPLIEKIVEMLNEEPQTAADFTERMELSVHKISGLLRSAVAQGKASVQDVKVKGKGTCKGYTKA